MKPVRLGEGNVAGPAVDRDKGVGIGGLSPDGPLEIVLAPLIFGGMAVGRDREEKVEPDQKRVLAGSVGHHGGLDLEPVTEKELPDIGKTGRRGKKGHDPVDIIGGSP